MKGLFQCPPRAMPWARSFCPFRAYWIISTVQIVLFLGFEYFNAIYFSDLSIFAIFASVIQIVTIMTEYIHRNIDSEEKSFIIMITHHKEINARSQLALQ